LLLLLLSVVVAVIVIGCSLLLLVVVDCWLLLPFLVSHAKSPQNTGVLMLNSSQSTPRRRMYAEVLSKVRHVIIARMAKPEEVIVVEDENGNIVRELRKDGMPLPRDARLFYFIISFSF
jgi:hypothetical protein